MKQGFSTRVWPVLSVTCVTPVGQPMNRAPSVSNPKKWGGKRLALRANAVRSASRKCFSGRTFIGLAQPEGFGKLTGVISRYHSLTFAEGSLCGSEGPSKKIGTEGKSQTPLPNLLPAPI